jgi:hypothetical protein
MYKIVNINYLIILGSLCLIFSGCQYAPYRYSFSLVEPESEALGFEDNNVLIRFLPSPEKIWVSIRNKTDREIYLVRDKAEFIDHLGESSSVVYGRDFVSEIRLYADNRMYVPPMRIDPGSEITGNVWINIWLDYSMMRGRRAIISEIDYYMQPFFPRNSHEGSGEDLKDSTFKLILPIDFDGHISNYMFTFMINDVVE